MSIERHIFRIESATPPVVEIDYEAMAVYVRFKKAAVVKTISQPSSHMHIAVDLDSKGNVIGIEAVGCDTFSLQAILQKARVEAPRVDFSRAKIVPTGLVAA